MTQVGVVLYTASSFLPTAASFAVNSGLSYMGAPASVSTAFGTTTAIVTGVMSGDVVTPVVSLVGSLAGSYAALQAKNKVSAWLFGAPQKEDR